MDNDITSSIVVNNFVDVNNITASFSSIPVTSSSELTIKDLIVKQFPTISGDTRIISVLVKEIENLKSEMLLLKNNKFIETSGLPKTIINNNPDVLFKKTPRIKRGWGYRQLLESEIKDAQSQTVTEKDASKRLGVSFNTYYRWAIYYGIYRYGRKSLKGLKKRPNAGVFPLKKILNGELNDLKISSYIIRRRLLDSDLKLKCCDKCGFDKTRDDDGHIPLLLVFDDNNEYNRNLENLKFYCYNCYFLYISEQKKQKYKHNLFSDPSKLQMKMDG